MTARAARQLFVSSYTDSCTGGIYTVEFNQTERSLRIVHEGGRVPNPSFIAQCGQHLYAAQELKARGCLTSYEVQDDGSLAFRGEYSALCDAGTCFVTASPDARFLYGANYISGSVMGCAVSKDGRLSGGQPSVRHHGSSANPERQTSAHVHSMSFVPGTNVLAVVDLGSDKVVLYQVDEDGTLLQPPYTQVNVPAGSGPRMLAFRPKQRLVALVDELANDVWLFRYDTSGLIWEAVDTLALSDDSLCDGSTILAAHLAFSPNGRHLYVSVRGSDVIVVFELDEAGTAMKRHEFASGGHSPRHFSLSPDGELLAVANQDSNNVVLFAIDEQTGALDELARLTLPQPSCVIWDA